ncbi:mRNA-decapping enzyme subunit 2 [Rhizophlyctis rosea]|uniref:mRNA-decapping enzyme subunit 2 n=1 Tax=Rhizophlyctis rosea TaxID=64517 RepID=A0AAD5SE79_9FUNG|nr:mRNA-decapping enzyme subunit 2 [Rhizophlyctis rosea]
MSFVNMSFEEVLDDLQSRFIINIPEEELSSVERICFQIEQAHWFYEDFVREENPRLPSFSLKHFSARFFRHCPLLHRWAHDHEKAFTTFMEYKVRVPVCGAIILNEAMDKVLLVKGWKQSSGWGFPKGKINKDEPEAPCAIREVKEETGFDIGPNLHENEYVERTMKEQRIRLYLITGIPEATIFAPQTRKEIGAIKWHKLSDLPGWNKDDYGVPREGRHRFYMVTAFVSGLRQWLIRYRKAKRQGKARNGRNLSVVMGYKTATDSEGEGAASDYGSRFNFSEGAGALEGGKKPLATISAKVENGADSAEATAMTIKALIGIGGTGTSSSAPGAGVSQAAFAFEVQPGHNVAHHIPHHSSHLHDIYGRPMVEQFGIEQHPAHSAQPVYPHIHPGPPLPFPPHANLSFPSSPPQYPPPFIDLAQSHHFPPPSQNLPLPVPQPIPIAAVSQNREAHRATLLNILANGPAAQGAATIPVPMGIAGSAPPPPLPLHPAQTPMPVPTTSSMYPQPPSPPYVPASPLRPSPVLPAGAAPVRKNSSVEDKQKMLLSILLGDGGGPEPVPVPNGRSGGVQGVGVGHTSDDDALKKMLGIGVSDNSASSVQTPSMVGMASNGVTKTQEAARQNGVQAPMKTLKSPRAKKPRGSEGGAWVIPGQTVGGGGALVSNGTSAEESQQAPIVVPSRPKSQQQRQTSKSQAEAYRSLSNDTQPRRPDPSPTVLPAVPTSAVGVDKNLPVVESMGSVEGVGRERKESAKEEVVGSDRKLGVSRQRSFPLLNFAFDVGKIMEAFSQA